MTLSAHSSSSSRKLWGGSLTFTNRQTNIRFFVEPRASHPVKTRNGIEWPVDRILKVSRKRLPGRKKRSTRYLVRWVGYPKARDTWEPARNVRDCAALDFFEGQSAKKKARSVSEEV
ncbi:hypothetical protein DFP72DRAFT_1064806 [Ephemerocybe angulata]|uniref:Chromo domain-containing protein n=1 Tax=Ephemerocybe angulata TaxID=980116 RepID=A0A8H6I7D3_9AGAR|nr:hypothetical protein DFP72DRAFT_1064806 [Tulosesus angulatus]